jgi:hypothetical protein
MKTFGITYRESKDESDDGNLFNGFSDAAFVNQNDGKSTSGYVFLASSCAITWKSKKQSIITLSTTESYTANSDFPKRAQRLYLETMRDPYQ